MPEIGRGHEVAGFQLAGRSMVDQKSIRPTGHTSIGEVHAAWEEESVGRDSSVIFV